MALAASAPPKPLQSLASPFANPPMSSRPMFRWWWPHGLIDASLIREEIDEMIATGFGGAEIEDVHPSIKQPLDPVGHGWGSKPWIEAVETALQHANARSFRIDIALGPSWPAAVPSISPGDDEAAKELVHGLFVLSNGTSYDGPLPSLFRGPAQDVTKQDLFAVQAWRISLSSNPKAKVLALDDSSFQDLTTAVDMNNRLKWEPPDDATWVVLAYWIRGTGQQPEGGPHTVPASFVVDHFSEKGTSAVTKYWDGLLVNNRLKSLFQSNGGSIFEDSLELSATTFWTPQLPGVFQARHNYSILSVLPVIIRQGRRGIFTFMDADKARGALNDYWSVMNDLFNEKHIKALRTWSKDTLNMTLRAQPYGLQTEAMSTAPIIDIPEGETLSFKNLDDYRALASAGHLAGRNIISSESGALANGAYSTTLETMLKILNPIFATGVNQHVLHGFSYSGAVPGTQWPGFAAFSPMSRTPGFSESWGPRQPLWRHMGAFAAYLGRMQWFLRQGVPKYDVAFFMQKGYVGSGTGAKWFSKGGLRNGWTLGFLSPGLLELPNAVVKDGVLAPQGPGYKLLVLDGDAFADGKYVISTESLKKIAEFAAQGLPVLVVGNWSSPTVYGYGERGKGELLKARFEELVSKKSVLNVRNWEEVDRGIEALQLKPRMSYVEKSSLLYHHRVDGTTEYFVFVGSSVKESVDHDVLISRINLDAVPFELDPWSGAILQAASYSSENDGKLRYRVQLKPGQTKVVLLIAVDDRRPHVVSTTAPEVLTTERGLIIRSFQPGSFTTRLSNGSNIQTSIGPVAPPLRLDHWTLEVESFEPGETTTATKIVHHSLNITSLAPWTELPGLKDVSGIGKYSTTFSLSQDWADTTGAILKLAKFEGSFQIKVNNNTVPADQLLLEHDIGNWLRSGINRLEIEVASTLLNRLRVTIPAAFEKMKRQEFGLREPVDVVPYEQRQIIIS